MNIAELADILELDYIETTSQRNGYPSNLKFALTGFDTFEQAQEVADEYGLSIEVFSKRDGWSLWYRTGNAAYEPFCNDEGDYGDNYSSICKMDEQSFLEQEVDEVLRYIEFEDVNSLVEFANNKKEIWDEVDAMDDDEIVITHFGKYYETIGKRSMNFYHDTQHLIIGLIKRD